MKADISTVASVFHRKVGRVVHQTPRFYSSILIQTNLLNAHVINQIRDIGKEEELIVNC
jgi:hypothetical protein